MHLKKLGLLSVGLAMVLAGCSEPAGTLPAASKALDAPGTTSISFTGTGKWYQFGQAPVPGQAWPAFDVSAYSQTVSYSDPPAGRVEMTRLQVVDPNRTRPAPVEQKVDQYVVGDMAWNVAANGTVAAQPAAVQERIMEVWATPHGFLRFATANQASVTPADGGSEVSLSVGNLKLTGTINAQNDVTRVVSAFDNPVTGDTPVEFVYSNYKDFNGVRFPGRIVRTQAGHPVLEIDVASVTKNPAVNFAVPDDVKSYTAPPINVEVEQLADGVYYLKGGSHHSLLIDQADHLVVVEGPQSEARGQAVIDKAKELVPNKPIRYVINTHVHFDHSGGLRPFVAEGATVVTHESARPFYETAWNNPRMLGPDAASKAGKPATFETVGDKHVLTDGKRPIEIHAIQGSGHADGFLMVYLPNEKILAEADAYSPGPADAPPPATPNPYSVNLYENIERLGLDVATIAPIHGRQVTMADLRRDIGVPEPAAAKSKAKAKAK
jgi:glyoxylase-like metal-dependent hydrolase (beta-lactamase superfamily II)